MRAENADCLFCKIVEGKIHSQKIYEDPNVIAFRDINPQARLHYLFVPKKHFDSLNQIDDFSIMSQLFSAIHSVVEKEPLLSGGYKTLINVGKDGGQVVFHLHVHLMGGRA